jgi:hypothetical protein
MAYIGFFNGPNSVLSNVDQIGFRSINFKQKTQTVITKTISGRSIRTQQATTLWEGTLEFPTLTHQQFRQVQGFVALAQGSFNEFDIILPNISSRTGGGQLFNLAVKDDLPAGTTTISAYQVRDSAGQPIKGDGDSAGYTEADGFTILNMGDIIRFDNHNKVYMCTTDITPDTSGDFDIPIQPALTTAVTGMTGKDNTDYGDITEITYDDVPFRMIFKGDSADYRYNLDGTVNFRIDIEEVL